MQILVEPKNPLDLRPDKIKPLMEAIQNLDSSYEVHLAYIDQRGYGVTFWEVLSIWIPWKTLSGVAAAKLVEIAIEWAYGRLKGEEPKNRPRSVSIYGPKGELLKEIKVDKSGQEVKEERTAEQLNKMSRPTKPPIRD